ncbi:MAG TPA: enoyl-CoA hydratase [Acidimicrobiales bacterium]|nr:enoyl-CoA hydratase [Acidimicrobiales bacterium]
MASIVIDRVERRNALDTESCRQLHSALTGAVADGARAVVLSGEGGNFCAGADLGTVRDAGFGTALRSVLDALCELPVACIAAVEGFALGAGVQLAVACDLRVVQPSARFGVPAARLGLMVDHWTVQRVATMVGHATARAMLMAAEQIDGETALRLGLGQRSGGPVEALAWAREIAALAPLSVAGHKLALNRLEAAPSDADVEAAHRRAWSSADVAEGMLAFREKRPPRFSGS